LVAEFRRSTPNHRKISALDAESSKSSRPVPRQQQARILLHEQKFSGATGAALPARLASVDAPALDLCNLVFAAHVLCRQRCVRSERATQCKQLGASNSMPSVT
jgi:hypothetical protein